MVLLVVSMSLFGPLIWNTDLSRVASSPLNLPPAWVGSEEEVAEEVPEAQGETSATASTADQAEAAAAAADESERRATRKIAALPVATRWCNSRARRRRPQAAPAASPAAIRLPVSRPMITEGASESSDSAAAATPASSISNATRDQLAARRARSSTSRFGTPTWEHPLGTESSGRDMLAVLLVGAPRSLWIGIIAAGIGMLVGILLGFTAGFVGGWVDTVIRTLSDAFITIPSLAVLIVISAFVSFNNITYMALMLALFAWPGPTRLLRSQVLSMRERGYVQMAQLSGASIFSIMFFEMMPNLLPYLAASFTGNVSGAILAATGLETLGLGPNPYSHTGHHDLLCHPRRRDFAWHVVVVGRADCRPHCDLYRPFLDDGRPRRNCQSALERSPIRMTASPEVSTQMVSTTVATDGRNSNVVLDVQNLKVYYHTPTGAVRAVDDISFQIYESEIVGLVGESGCGKTTTAMAILRLVQPPGRIVGGNIFLDGVDMTALAGRDLRDVRWRSLALIPQGAMNSLNPIMRIKDQIADAIETHEGRQPAKVLRERILDLLRMVGLPTRVYEMYPHELSGGMKQRVCIAMAVGAQPAPRHRR